MSPGDGAMPALICCGSTQCQYDRSRPPAPTRRSTLATSRARRARRPRVVGRRRFQADARWRRGQSPLLVRDLEQVPQDSQRPVHRGGLERASGPRARRRHALGAVLGDPGGALTSGSGVSAPNAARRWFAMRPYSATVFFLAFSVSSRSSAWPSVIGGDARRRHRRRPALAQRGQDAAHVVGGSLLRLEALPPLLLALRGASGPDARGPPPAARTALPVGGHRLFGGLHAVRHHRTSSTTVCSPPSWRTIWAVQEGCAYWPRRTNERTAPRVAKVWDPLGS